MTPFINTNAWVDNVLIVRRQRPKAGEVTKGLRKLRSSQKLHKF
jgi:hypothetical protein